MNGSGIPSARTAAKTSEASDPCATKRPPSSPTHCPCSVHGLANPRLFLRRASRVSEPLHMVCEPAVCFVAQGRKQAMAGEGVSSLPLHQRQPSAASA